MPRMDDAVGRKLRIGWICGWSVRSAGVRVPRKVDDNRHVDVAPASPGMAAISGYLHAAEGRARSRRLDDLGRHGVRQRSAH